MIRRPIDILLVEDNPADVTLVREGFKEAKMQHALHVTRDGEQALEFLQRRGDYVKAPRPHLVLLDLNLPKKPGTEVLCTMKEDPALKAIPVLIYTSSSSDQDVNTAYQCGANAYLRKPRSLDDIYDIVATLEHFWLELAVLPSLKYT